MSSRLWWFMTIIRCFLKRWRIALGATLGLALTTTDASNGEATRCARPTVVDRATSASPAAFSDQKRVDLNAGRHASSAATKVWNECCDECCDDFPPCRQPLAGSSSEVGYDINVGGNGPAATPVRTAFRPRIRIIRLHRGFWPSRPVATPTRQLSGDPDDDKASDDPNDDDDAYEDLDVYEGSHVPIAACLLESVSYGVAPEFAPKAWVAAPPSTTSFSTLQRLRC
jgi:hypothetical protein